MVIIIIIIMEKKTIFPPLLPGLEPTAFSHVSGALLTTELSPIFKALLR